MTSLRTSVAGHQRAEVDGDAAGRQPLEVLVVAGPVHRLAGAGQRLAAGGLRRPERRRVALADDLAGDALAQVALAAAVDEQRRARLPLHVDEARGSRPSPTASITVDAVAA